MIRTRILRVEVDGHPPTAEELWYPALVNHGHITVMQVRDGRTRGLDLHLRRLDDATRELYGTGLDGDLVRDRVRHALGEDLRDASVRLSVFRPGDDGPVSAMVAVRPPATMPDTPQKLRSVAYERPLAHVKHAGSFAQIEFGRAAERDGFDDALLVGPGGIVSETAIANLGCYDGSAVVWPDAPSLTGITMRLVEDGLAERGVPARRGTVRLADLPSFRAVFVTNSSGVAPVGRVDDLSLPADAEFMTALAETYDAVPWDVI